MIDTIIIKVIRACNLRCDYCYYINNDTKNYGLITATETIERIYEKFSRYAGDSPVEIVWHGGEPLMLGRERFETFLALQSKHFDRGVVSNKIQTNGSLINADWVKIFRQYNISVGVSLDGLRGTHNRRRKRMNGTGSFFEAMRAIRLLRNSKVPVGVLAVVDGDAPGAATMRFLNRLGVASVEFLLPISNHALLRAEKSLVIDFKGIGRFLSEAFQQWLDFEGERVPVDLFEALILNAFARYNEYAYTGPSFKALSRYVIVETDGEICLDEEYGQLDRFGIALQHYVGLNVNDTNFSFAVVERELEKVVITRRLAELPDDCSECKVRAICRGSHPGTRYCDVDRSYNKRSIYCDQMFDLSSLILSTIKEAGMIDRVKDQALRAYAGEI